MIHITNTIKAKYYTYIPGEFTPIMREGELDNKREFHKYKLRRAAQYVQNWKIVYRHYTHQAG